MADLSDAIASNKKIQELEKELKLLTHTVEGPKYLYDQTSKVYPLDPKAYYDPSINDKLVRIKYLESKIKQLNEQMKLGAEKPVKMGVGKMKFEVQNYRNWMKEGTNDLIGDSYYYQVGNSHPVKPVNNGHFEPKNMPKNIRDNFNGDPRGAHVDDLFGRQRNAGVSVTSYSAPQDRFKKDLQAQGLKYAPGTVAVFSTKDIVYDNKHDIEKQNTYSNLTEKFSKYAAYRRPQYKENIQGVNSHFQDQNNRVEADQRYGGQK